jgi:N-acetylglucosaminyldiphosphoundecaprenol N-acetyl-beta-D-mannosaminyltransferase
VSTKRLRIGKLWVDVLRFEEALDAVEALVRKGQGGNVFTPNVDHVVMVESNEAFAQAYSRAALCLADGMPLVWGSRLLGLPLPERVAGSDLVLPLLERAAQRQWRVFFLGANEGVADKAAEVVRQRFGTNVVGTDAPRITLGDTAQLDRIGAQLNAAQPHLVLMAFGAPKQEFLMDALADRVRPAVCLGIGASLDFIAGTVKRAPAFMRRSGLEWLYRLGQEPRRLWRRYLINDPLFAAILMRTLRDGQR